MNFFYNRTAYKILNVEIPKCFLRLDFFFPSGKSLVEIDLVENICRRMADVEYYANEIGINLKRKTNLWNETILIGTLLVSYYMSCKSLLDAIAISLNYIYGLSLSEKEQDFTKKKFWEHLEKKDKKIYKKYQSFKKLSYEIRDWRDAAIHRVTPFVIVVGPGNPGEIPSKKFNIKLISEKGVSMYNLVSRKSKPKFLNPLYHYFKWRSSLLKLCEDICEDIEDSLENK